MACRYFFSQELGGAAYAPLIAVTWNRGERFEFPSERELVDWREISSPTRDAKRAKRMLSAPQLVPVVEHYRPHILAIERIVLDCTRTLKVQARQLISHGIYTGVAASLRVPAVLEVLPLTVEKYFAIVGRGRRRVLNACGFDFPEFIGEDLTRQWTIVDEERAFTLLLAKYAMDFMDRAYEKGVRVAHRPRDHIPRFWAMR